MNKKLSVIRGFVGNGCSRFFYNVDTAIRNSKGIYNRKTAGNMANQRLSDHAFSLIEIVMALGILSFCLIAILGLIPVALQSVGATLNTNVQSRILQATRTELLNTPFTALSGTSYGYDEYGIAVSGTELPRYQVTVTITGSTCIPGGALNSVYAVQLTGSNTVTHQLYNNQIHLPDNGF